MNVQTYAGADSQHRVFTYLNGTYAFPVPFGQPQPTEYKLGDVDGMNGITIFDALEILKELVAMPSKIDVDNLSRNAALITINSRNIGTPTIFDALEILKYLVNMPSLVK